MKDLLERLERLDELAKAEKLKGEFKEKERFKLELRKTDTEKDTQILLQVRELYKSLGGLTEEKLMESLSMFVTYGLQSVFSEEYRLVPEMSMEGTQPRLDFKIATGDLISSVTEAKGGGVAEVVSILLQIFFTRALAEKVAPFLLLDTAMIHLSTRYKMRVSHLLKELCEKLDMQILLIVNTNEYGEYADRVYKFSQEGGKTVVEEER